MWRETVKNVKNEKYTLWDLEYGEKTKKKKILENETQTLCDLPYGEKHRKKCQMRNTHCKNWDMARNSEKREEGEIHTIEPGLRQEK